MGARSRRRVRKLAAEVEFVAEQMHQQASSSRNLPQALTKATQSLEHLTLQSELSGIGLQSSGSGHININGDFIAGVRGAHGITLSTIQSLTFSDQEKPKRKPFSTVPFRPDADFVDRPEILAWLHGKIAEPAARVALVGLGGIGKSQIAIHYCHTIHGNSPATFVFWVLSSTQGRFQEAYRGIADRLDLPGRFNPHTNVLQLVYNWLSAEENGKWLMVLDNVDDGKVFFPTAGTSVDTDHKSTPLATYIPQSSNGSVLVTARDKDAALRLTGDSRNIQIIQGMDESMAIELLRNKLHNTPGLTAATSLIRALEYLPLAITQAAAYINQRTSTVQAYWSEFQKSESKKKRLLLKDKGDLRRDPSASHSVLTTWKMSFELIRTQRPSGANLLSLMSFFNPQDIPKWIFTKDKYVYTIEPSNVESNGDSNWFSNEDSDMASDSDMEFEDDIDMLKAFCLISESTEGSLNLHALVQFGTKVWLSDQGTIHEWEERFLLMMSKEFPDGRYDNWATCQELLPHVAELDKVVPRKALLGMWAQLFLKVARHEYIRCHYRMTRVIATQSMEASLMSDEDNSPFTLGAMSLLTTLLRRQVDLGGAERQVRLLLKDSHQRYGEGHGNTFKITRRLAVAFQGLQKVLAENDRQTPKIMGLLASIITHLSKYEEAEELLRKVLEGRRKTIGKQHYRSLGTMVFLKGYLAKMSWYEEEACQCNRTSRNAKAVRMFRFRSD